MKNNYITYQAFIEKNEDKVFDFRTLPIFPEDNSIIVEHMVRYLRDIIRMYECATIADLYDAIRMYTPGYSGHTLYTHHKYGWRYINDIFVLHLGTGVTIGLKCDPIPLE